MRVYQLLLGLNQTEADKDAEFPIPIDEFRGADGPVLRIKNISLLWMAALDAFDVLFLRNKFLRCVAFCDVGNTQKRNASFDVGRSEMRRRL